MMIGIGACESLFDPVGGAADIACGNLIDGVDDRFHKRQNLIDAFDEEHHCVVDRHNGLDDGADGVEHGSELGDGGFDDRRLLPNPESR